MMRWMTEAQVLKAAHKSDRAALLNSIAHWAQLASASKTEFLGAVAVDRVGIGTHFCALCLRQEMMAGTLGSCEGCPLFVHGDECNNSPDSIYENASRAYPVYKDAPSYNHRTFCKAACCMRDLLIHLRDKHKDGDYSHAPDGKG